MPTSKFLTASMAIAALTMGTLFTPATAAPAGAGLSSVTVPDALQVEQVRWRNGGYYRGYHGGYYRGYRGYGGAAAAAGVIGGLALGAAAAGAAGAPGYYAPGYDDGGYAYAQSNDDWVSYCSSKYRSFDPASGTYLGYDGVRHPCQ